MATPTEPPKPRYQQPGVLRSQTVMEIQTRHAQRLVYGRRAEGGKPAIIGLMRFSAMLRPIWSGAANDDPWADWWLVRIERELQESKEALEALMGNVEKRLRSVRGVDVELAHSIEPVRVSLSFSSPYAFMGAYLLADFDALVRATLTGRHVGLLDRLSAERNFLYEGGRIVRRAFNAAYGYRYLGVVREDLRQGTAKAKRARDMLGDVPQEVVDGELRAAHAPDIKTRTEKPVPSKPDGLDDEDNDIKPDALEGEDNPLLLGRPAGSR